MRTLRKNLYEHCRVLAQQLKTAAGFGLCSDSDQTMLAGTADNIIFDSGAIMKIPALSNAVNFAQDLFNRAIAADVVARAHRLGANLIRFDLHFQSGNIESFTRDVGNFDHDDIDDIICETHRKNFVEAHITAEDALIRSFIQSDQFWRHAAFNFNNNGIVLLSEARKQCRAVIFAIDAFKKRPQNFSKEDFDNVCPQF